MPPKKENLILTDKLVIYNNFAKINDCEGRLLVELQIYPTPRIIWDFEIMGEQECDFLTIFDNNNLKQSFFMGNSLRVEALSVIRFNLGGSASGSASKVFFGDPEDRAHTFHFCITNTKFLEQCITQDRYEETVCEKRVNSEESNNALRSRRIIGRFIEVSVNSIWSVRLEIMEDSLNWLNKEQGNIGTRLTGIDTIYQPKRAEAADDFPDSLTSLTITEAQEMIGNLCRLLSYANGGFVAPIFIESEKYNPEEQEIPRIQTVSALTRTDYQVTSLEQLGSSWLTELSNLKAFVSCFSNFEKMLTQPFWKDTFYFVLIQYFQATRYGDWQVAASSTGAALERLSHAILVEDETDPTKRQPFKNLFSSDRRTRDPANQSLGSGTKVTETRLRCLLERIGLTSGRGYNDVQIFLDVRNDAVHPKVGGMTLEERWRSIFQGIQWIDEVLLWRLGYDGKYLDRITCAAMVFPIPGSTPITSSTLEITPRYNLCSRDPNW
jgi:hypothetical protein